MKLSDQFNRAAAIDPLKSVCVTAPAGSGKTELLIQRILVLLARVNNPEEILAITFTRKAAAEMHYRVVQALELGSQEQEPLEQHKRLTWSLGRQALSRSNECGWQLLDNPNRLKVQTIDSFCARLTRQMPVLSKFGSQPQVSSTPERFYRQAVRDLLSGLEQDGPVADMLTVLIAHLDNNMLKVEELLVSLLQHRDQWLVHIVFSGYGTQVRAGLEQTAQQIIRDALDRVALMLKPCAGELLPLMDYAGSHLTAEKNLHPAHCLQGIDTFPEVTGELGDVWLSLLDLLLTKSNDWRKKLDKRIGFPTKTLSGDKQEASARKQKMLNLIEELSSNDALHEALIELRDLPVHQYPEQQWQLIEALSILLPVLSAQLQTVFQQHGEVDYVQIAISALESLGSGDNPSELLLKLDYQLQHILLDEFQDTSSSQFELLKLLIEGWSEANKVNPLNPRTVFIVGDGMQSIYGFRQANVGLFLDARRAGINQLLLEDTPLSVNFRSSETIVDWINKVFSQSFPRCENISRGAVKYEHSQSFNKGTVCSATTVSGFSGEQAKNDEADHVVELIKNARDANPDSEIAILVRGRNHLKEIIPALKDAGIEWVANDIDLLTRYPFIRDLFVLSKAMANVHDSIAWAALLRSPLCGLDNKELYLLLAPPSETVWAAMNKPEYCQQLSSNSKQRLATIRSSLAAAFSQSQRKSFRVWVEGVWLSLGGASLLTDIDQFSSVDDYFDLVESMQEAGSSIDFDQLQDLLNKLYASTTVQRPLQIMTIHKAKGLEFDTVILPGLARPPRNENRSLLMWNEYLSETGSGLLIAAIAAVGDADDGMYKHLQSEQSKSQLLENTRLMYVACTRARNQLHLTFSVKDATKPPPARTLLRTLWEAVEDSVQWPHAENRQGQQIDINLQSTPLYTQQLQRINSDWKPPAWSFQNPLSGFYLNTEVTENDLNRPSIESDPCRRITGLVIHAILESLTKQEHDFWIVMAPAKKQLWIKQLFLAEQLYLADYQQLLIEVCRHIDNVINDERGRWIVSNKHPQSFAEYVLSAIEGGRVQHRIIDRLLYDQNGDCWIIDYKTGQPLAGEDKAIHIERELIRYSGQIENYKRYICGIQPELDADKIRIALYFTHYPYYQELTECD